MLLASWEMPAEAEAPTRAEFLAVRLFFPSRVRGTRSSLSLPADAKRLLCLSRCLRLVEPIRRSCWVFCPMCLMSCHVMSWCIGVSARACGLIALQCTLCVFVQLLLIYDIKSASSALVAASAMVGACCLLACGARRLCRVVQSLTDGWTAKRAATSTMSGVVVG
jgi:hypothetical protein